MRGRRRGCRAGCVVVRFDDHEGIVVFFVIASDSTSQWGKHQIRLRPVGGVLNALAVGDPLFIEAGLRAVIGSRLVIAFAHGAWPKASTIAALIVALDFVRFGCSVASGFGGGFRGSVFDNGGFGSFGGGSLAFVFGYLSGGGGFLSSDIVVGSVVAFR